MSASGGHQLGARLLVGSLASAAVFGLLWMDAHQGIQLGLSLLMLAGTTLALSEFYNLTGKLGHHPLRRTGLGLGTLATVHWLWLRDTFPMGQDPLPAYLLILLFSSLTELLMRPEGQRKMEDAALTLLGWVLIWVPISYGLRLRLEPAFQLPLIGSPQAGQAAVAFALTAGKGSDIVAYFIGSRLGRNPLAPSISPKKTWEGLGGALLGGALGGWAVARFWPALPVKEVQAAVLGGIIGLAGQFSDLCESMLKRQAGVKDSGAIPALGGMLDMLDSLLLALPVAYYGLLICRRMA